MEGTCLTIIKATYYKLTANIILNCKKPESISSKIKNKTRVSTLLPLLFKLGLEVLATAIRKEK